MFYISTPEKGLDLFCVTIVRYYQKKQNKIFEKGKKKHFILYKIYASEWWEYLLAMPGDGSEKRRKLGPKRAGNRPQVHDDTIAEQGKQCG